MRVLVTGGGGFVARYVAIALAERGHQVTASYRSSPGPLLEAAKKISALQLVHSDLEQRHEIDADADAIIHLAATSPATNVTVAKMVGDNIIGTQNIIRFAEERGIMKVVNFSSISVYGDVTDEVVDENTAITNPDSYGTTKLIAEHLIQQAADRIAFLSLRLPGVIGPNARRNWLSGVVAKAMVGEEIVIYNPDAVFNNAVHVDDLARFLDHIMARELKGADHITLAAKGSLTVREIVERIISNLGSHSKIRIEDGNRSSFSISIDRARQVYGYDPTEIGTMIDRYLNEVNA